MDFQDKSKEELISELQAQWGENHILKTLLDKDRDITERKRAELSLQEKTEEIEVQDEEYQQINEGLYRALEKAEEEEKQLQTLFDNLSDGIGISKSGISCFINNSYLKMFGYEDADEIIGKSLLEQISPKEHEKILHCIANRYTDKNLPTQYETIGIKKNGQEFPLELFVGTYQLNKEYYSFGILRDITQRKQIERELISAKERAEENEERFRNAIEKSPIPTAIAENDGKVIYLNKQFVQTYGYTLQEIPSMEVWFAKAYPDTHYRSFVKNDWGNEVEQSIANDVPTGNKEYFVTCKSGEIKTVSVSAYFEKDIAVGLFQDITERRRAEEMLKESDARYRSYIDVTGQIGWVTNAAGEIVEDVPSLRKFTGQTYEEVKGSGWAKTLHPDDLEHTLKVWRDAVTRKDSYEAEYRMRRHDGLYRDLLARGFPVMGEDGRILEWIGTCIDISARKQAEAALRASEIRARGRLEFAVYGILEGSPDGTITEANVCMCALTGLPREALIGKSIRDLTFAPESIAQQPFRFDLIHCGEVVVRERKLIRPDGSTVLVEMHSNQLPNGTLQSFFQDITERKRAEEALVNLNLKIQTIINNFPNGSISLIDKNHFIQITGGSDYQKFNLNSQDFINKHVSEVLSPKIYEINNPHISEAFNGKSSHFLVDFNGFYYMNYVFPIPNNQKETEFVILMSYDITELKTTEFELISAKEKAEESDKLKSAFLANMSHEIRTPMNGILGFADLLKEPGLTGKQQQEYIRIIEKSGDRMLNIINDIVDISKIGANLMQVNIKDVNINEKIEFIYNFYKPQVEEKGIQLLFKNTLQAKEAIIRTDHEKVFSILTNLLKNAIKYSDRGTIEFGYLKRDKTLEFYVKDTGIGIPKDRQAAIFERFIQADILDKMARQGAGLGLSISKAYVEMLGGKIWVVSEEGIGSTFYFTLPYNTNDLVL